MKEKVIFLLLILLILASCAGNRKYDDLMQRADSIMNVNDDSAKVAIRMLDGVKSQLPEFSKSQKMRYELFRIGGDELLVICPNITRADTDNRLDQLRNTMKDYSVNLAIGMVWKDVIGDNLEKTIIEAENRMGHTHN